MSFFERKILINEYSEAINPDLWGEDYVFFPTEFQNDSWFLVPTFVIYLASGLLLSRASGYQPKTWLSAQVQESLVHYHSLEFLLQANYTERSLSNKLKIHKIEARQRQQL